MHSELVSMRVWRNSALFFVLLVMLFTSACGKKKNPKPMVRVPKGYTETGLASWYGHPYHGRRAANGEVYDMEKMTAAHRTLPFDTVLRVTNLENGKTTEVRITDRGPFIDGRIVDLSRAAASEIDLIRPGTARVRLEAVRVPSSSSTTVAYGVQVGSFREKRNAERLRNQLAVRFSPVEILERDTDRKLWRVIVGRKPTAEAAQELASSLESETGKTFVVRLD